MINFEFKNKTPFTSEQLILLDELGKENLVVVTKATYDINETPKLKLSDEQAPLILSPEYYGEPGQSSIKYDSEAVLTKLTTDIVLIGHAWPKKARDTQIDIMVQVGSHKKKARVFGDRCWTKLGGLKNITSPKPFEKIPLMYERAFGGWDRTNSAPEKHSCHPMNSVGLGYADKKNGKFEEGKKLPNIEDPSNLIGDFNDIRTPVGFGFTSPDWEPRIKYTGTYDKNWQESRMPLLPNDFDQKFYNAAHSEFISKNYLKGDEQVALYFVSPEKKLIFKLPEDKKPIPEIVMKDGEKHTLDTNLDTVIINTDEKKLFLIWRGKMEIHNKIYDVRCTSVTI